MFKFVVLCALVAAATATATPDIIAPFPYPSRVLAPATTIVSGYPNNLVYSSPYYPAPSYYSSPFGYSHLIKKRSAPLAVNSYIAPPAYVTPTAYASAPLAATYTAAAPLATTYTAAAPFATYAAGAPLVAPYGAAPFAYGNPIYSSAAYLIKK